MAIREQSLCHDRSSGRWHWNTATGSCTSHWHGRPSSQDKNTAHTVAIMISFFVTLLCCSSSPVPVSNGRECSLAVDSSLFAVSQSTSSPAANDCRCCCCCCRCLTAEHQELLLLLQAVSSPSTLLSVSAMPPTSAFLLLLVKVAHHHQHQQQQHT